MPNWINVVLMPVVSTLVAGLTAAVKHLWSKQKAQEAAQKAAKQARDEEVSNMREGMLALMHDRIYSAYAECKQKKYASVDDIKNLEYLYRPYYTLGGNGTGTELFERVKKMPTEPPQAATA